MRRSIAVIGVVVGMVGFASACGGSDDDGRDADVTTEIDTTITLELEDGELVGGVRRESASLGDTVVVRVVGETDEQIHVHGYDLYIEPDGDHVLQFDALIPGRFEVEFEQSGQLLIELTVS